MALIRWGPVRELNSIQNEMNRLFNTFLDSPATTSNREGHTLQRWIPPMDLVETENDFVLRADLPGLAEDDVNIELENNVRCPVSSRPSTRSARRATTASSVPRGRSPAR